MVKSLEMETIAERWFPFLLTTLLYGFTYFLLLKANLPRPVYVMQIGGIFALAITTLINFKWKISAHMVGIGGLAGTFVGLQFYTGINQMHYILPGFILAGLLGVARLLLNAHSPAQVYAGFLLGFFSLIGVFLFL